MAKRAKEDPPKPQAMNEIVKDGAEFKKDLGKFYDIP
jgi:hypothetical protein